MAAGAATLALLAWSTADQLASGLDAVALRLVAVDVAVAVAAAGVVTGVLALTIGRFVGLPWAYLWAALSSLVLLGTLGAGASRRGWLVTVGVVVVGTSLVGGGLGRLVAGRRGVPGPGRPAAGLVAGLVVLGAPALWLATAGGPEPDVSVGDPAALAALTSDGSLEVEVTDYGSGTDRRDRYGTEVGVRTEPVDASMLLTGWSPARRSHWGFDAARLPLNARVWHPAEAGPFPLVLVVHGNTSTATGSELGFDYLGRHLASHGFVVATIDQNFLNTAYSDRAGGLTGAMPTRAWLVLEHLRAWHDWTQEPGHPLGGRVDLDHVGLVGHSRGGEAIAAAAHLAQRGSLPGHDQVDVADDVAIESLVALAPSEGQYLPGGQPIRLEDVDYLVLQGSHDADVGGFVGRDQYERVTFTGTSDRVKGAVYVARANHTQFNRGWGRHDVGNGLPKHFLDTTALLAPEAQRRITVAYASSFLRHTLLDEDAPLRLLEDHRWAQGVLPTPDLVTQYANAATDPLPEGMARDTEAGHEVTIEVPDDLEVDARSHLVVDAVALRDGAWQDEVAVEATDAAGTSAEVPLTDGPLQGVVPGQELKSAWLHDGGTREPVLQTYTVPLDQLVATNRALRLDDLRHVTVRFRDATDGDILLDHPGIRRPTSG